MWKANLSQGNAIGVEDAEGGIATVGRHFLQVSDSKLGGGGWGVYPMIPLQRSCAG